MDSRIRHLWRRTQSRLVATATLAAVAACTVGVPVPGVVAKNDSGVRYPCEHHACGCVDAAACWKQCCCFTDAQKLAWAKREAVEPPAALVAAVSRDRTPEAPAARGGHACCQAKPRGRGIDVPVAECAANRVASCRVARGAHSECGTCPRGTARDEARAAGVRFISIDAAMQCRGLTISVSSLPPSLPAAAPVSLPHYEEPEFFVPGERVLYEQPALSVASPPPDRAMAS